MPLEPGKSREAFSHNVAEMVKAGHPQKQAVAAAYREQRGDAESGSWTLEARAKTYDPDKSYSAKFTVQAANETEADRKVCKLFREKYPETGSARIGTYVVEKPNSRADAEGEKFGVLLRKHGDWYAQKMFDTREEAEAFAKTLTGTTKIMIGRPKGSGTRSDSRMTDLVNQLEDVKRRQRANERIGERLVEKHGFGHPEVLKALAEGRQLEKEYDRILGISAGDRYDSCGNAKLDACLARMDNLAERCDAVEERRGSRVAGAIGKAANRYAQNSAKEREALEAAKAEQKRSDAAGCITAMPGNRTLKEYELQGWNAKQQGFREADCPYYATSTASERWLKGFRNA